MNDIFLSYASEDRPRAETLARRLEVRGWTVWWDRTIPAGTSYAKEIAAALGGARCVVVLWSTTSVESDWVQNEARRGLKKKALVPVLIEQSVEMPLEFEHLHAANLVGWEGEDGAAPFRSLVSDLQRILGAPVAAPPAPPAALASPAPAGPPVPAGTSDLEDLASNAWVDVPGGSFQMGSEDFKDAPVHQVTVSGFKMSRFPVTNRQYLRYVEDMHWPPPGHWQEGRIPEGKEDHPVVRITWADADAFCSWLSRRIRSNPGGAVQLPTEAQWEFAARGAEGRRYPWGEHKPTAKHANFGRNVGDTTAVGKYQKGSTPSGIHDLAGNVWEWCQDLYAAYEKKPARDPVGPKSGSSRVLRGGSREDEASTLRSADRFTYFPDSDGTNIGFRVVWVSAGGQK